MKKYLNFIGLGVEPTGDFLHRIRRTHLLGRAKVILTLSICSARWNRDGFYLFSHTGADESAAADQGIGGGRLYRDHRTRGDGGLSDLARADGRDHGDEGRPLSRPHP